MGDAENALPPSKKRAAGRQLSRDNPGLDDDEEASEQETGTFKRASDDVLANRRIVKVRRQQTSSAPSSNPFARINLIAPPVSNATLLEVTAEAGEKTISEDVEGKSDVDKENEKEKDENGKKTESKVDEAGPGSTAVEKETDTVNEAVKPESVVEKAEADKTGTEDKKDSEREQSEKDAAVEQPEKEDEKDESNENAEKSAEAASFSSFQQLSSSQNAFTGLTGTGFSSSTFSFGSIPKDGSSSLLGSGPVFGLKTDQPSFGFGLPNNGNSSLFGTSGVNKREGSGIPSMQEVPVETGEENEEAVFAADSVLFEYLDGGWKERGKGELKVNIPKTETGKARLIMRAKGNFRLILNASLYPDMKLTSMEKKGITFACVNSTGEGKDGLSTVALKFKDAAIVEEFCAVVAKHKGKTAVALKTPENSPKASED